jgi:tripartite-type tricarboxylate transporter receptor subunit TctC
MTSFLRTSLLAIAASLTLIGGAQAQNNVTRMVVAFPPGGPVDLVGRILAQQLSEELGERVIVENRAGANGNIGADTVARGPADGTVMLLTSVGAVSVSPALYETLPYDPAKDFAPVSLVVNNAELFVVNPANPATDAKDFVARSKTAKQAVAIGSSGVGSIPHLTMELFAASSGANVLHVPYKGAAPVINDVMGNQVAGFFGDVPGVINFVKGGKLKAIGIASPKRHPLLPDVKTLGELGIKDVESNNWYGIVVPAKTPKATIDKLNAAVRKSLGNEAVRSKLIALGTEPAPSTPAELGKLIASDTAKWGGLIKAKNIKAE